MPWIDSNIERDVIEYLIAHKEGLKEKLIPEAALFLEKADMFQGVYRKPFENAYVEFLLGLLRGEIIDGLNLYSEQAYSLVTKELVEQILGSDFFEIVQYNK